MTRRLAQTAYDRTAEFDLFCWKTHFSASRVSPANACATETPQPARTQTN